MESITKRTLDIEELDSLVKGAFGSNITINVTNKFDDGWFNSVYGIQLNDGREVVLKIAPQPNIKVLRYEKSIMRTEVEVMRLLKANGNIPVPEVLFYDISGDIIKSEYFFMEKVKGQQYSQIKSTLTEEQQETIEKEIGKYNRRINDIKGKKFGLYSKGEGGSNKWSEAFLSMVKDVLEDGREYSVMLPMEYNKIENLFLERVDVLDNVKEPSLVHWDLHDGNIFINDNYKIEGLIDFERVLWGDPLMEVYFGDFFNDKYFCDGYGSELIDTAEAKCRRIMYNIYLYLIMVIECKYRDFQDIEHIKWTYSMLEEEIYKLINFNI